MGAADCPGCERCAAIHGDQADSELEAIDRARADERAAIARLVRHWGVDRERFVLEGPRAVVAELGRIEAAILARGGA